MKRRSYPEQPLVRVGALVFKGGSVRLVRRGKPPLEGTWSLPGGRCREDESLCDAVMREVEEECGIAIEFMVFLKLFEYIERGDKDKVKYHYIVFDFKVLYKSGILQHSSDASDARWVHISELDLFNLTDSVSEVIKKALEPN